MTSRLHTERIPALDLANERELVLLHGWGMDSGIWKDDLPRLRKLGHITLVDLPGFGDSDMLPENSLDAWLDCLQAECPALASYLGFSLGGMLAVAFAHRFPARVNALVSIASNACFVADAQWPDAMDRATFDNFFQLTAARPEQALKRFAALQAKDCVSERSLARQLRGRIHGGDEGAEALSAALSILASIDNRLALQNLDCRAAHIYGECDQLVPVEVAARISSLSKAEVKVIAGASHVPFISHPEESFSVIERVLQ